VAIRVKTLGPAPCPVLVVDCRSIFHRDRAHGIPLSIFVKQNYSQFVVLLGGHQQRSAFVLHEEQQKLVRYARKGL
jgi:hypothetical protein